MKKRKTIKKSFRKKLFLSLFLINFIFVSLIAALYCIYTWSTGVEQQEKYYVESVRRIQVQLDEMIREMDIVACQITANTDVQDVLTNAANPVYEERNYFEYNLVDKKNIQKTLWLFNSPVKRVHSINILSGNSLLGLNAFVDTIKIKENFESEEWQIEAKKYKVLAPHVDRWTSKEQDKVISLVREVVRTSPPFDKIGYVEIQQPYSMLEEICAREEEGTRILIVDHEGQVLYPYEEEYNYIDLLECNDEEKIFEYQNPDKLMEMGVYTSLENVGWNVLMLQERDSFFSGLRFVILMCVGIYAVLVVGATFIIIAASKWISDPIDKLAKEVQTVTLDDTSSLENFDIEVKEFQILQNSFVEMVEQLRESAVKLAVANESELRLKIDQLQAKINPHFLYNSLTAIGAAGIEAESETVENMCFQLSELFRYVSEDEPQIVSLQEEIEHVNMYLSFMKFRYEDAFLYEFITDGDFEKIPLCRLVFQPIVENCFQHGFKTVPQPFIIHVSCASDETGWHFSVKDNGCGFQESVLQKINNQIQMIDTIFLTGKNYESLQADNMALINVYIRLKFMYRNQIRLQIKNHSDIGGAEVSILFRKDETSK